MSGPLKSLRSALLVVLVLVIVGPAGATFAQAASCSYRSPGCAEWYVDDNGFSHSIRSDWRGLQHAGAYRSHDRHRHAETPAAVD
jgi:hypothetical protein